MKHIFYWIAGWIYLGILTAIATGLLLGLVWLNSFLIANIGIGTETQLLIFEAIYVFFAYKFMKKIIFNKLANYSFEATNPGEEGLIFFVIFACVRVVEAIPVFDDYPDLFNGLIKAPTAEFIEINNILSYLAYALGVIFTIRVAQIAYNRDKEYKETKIKETVEDYIRRDKNNREEINGEQNSFDYEKRIAELLERKGFINIEIAPRREVYGADLIAEYNDKKVCVQCVMNNSKTLVGIKTVQEIYSAKHLYDCDYAFVYTTSDYTVEAEELAEKLGVKLFVYK